MADEKIPGTVVPDTAIHRASLFLERVKFGDSFDRQTQPEMGGREFYEQITEQLELPHQPEDLVEASNYYARNFLRSVFGENPDTARIELSNGQVIPALLFFQSLWVDGYAHGAATRAGKRGLSNEERER